MSLRQVIDKYLPLLVLAVVFIVFLPCLRADFVNWDDDVHLVDNLLFQSPQWPNLLEIWGTSVNKTYIPLTSTTWALERYFFGFNPFVFHLNNVLLHLATTFLVIVFSRRLGLSLFAAAMSGLFFGIHPMHVESVAWVTERKDVLYGFFYMAALLSYLRYLDAGRKKYFWLTVFMGVVSVSAKSMAISLPFVLLILDFMRSRKWSVQVLSEKVYCGLFMAPIAYVTFLPNSFLVEPSAGNGILIWIWCFMFYIYKFIVAWPLILFYWLPLPIALSNLAYLFSVLSFCGVGILLWVLRRHRLLLFAAAFYLASIFFLLRFKPNLTLVSDRFMYLPSIGFCMCLAVVAERSLVWAACQKVYLYMVRLALSLFIIVLGVLSWRQCEVWQNGVTLWQHQLKYNAHTGVWLAQYQLANAYVKADKNILSDAKGLNKVYALYKQSAEFKPDFAQPYYQMGELAYQAHDMVAAESYYQAAIARDEKCFSALFKLGKLSQQQGQHEQALIFFQRALEANPENPILRSSVRDACDEGVRIYGRADLYESDRVRLLEVMPKSASQKAGLSL